MDYSTTIAEKYNPTIHKIIDQQATQWVTGFNPGGITKMHPGERAGL